MNIQSLLSDKIMQALIAAGAPSDCDALVKQSAKAQFGDYQANGIMAAAKKMGMQPRQLAEQVISHLDLTHIADKVEIAGPGFINIYLNKHWVAKQADLALTTDKLNITTTSKPQTVLVDYSAPNVAKEMHVGHLRSTIIGDATVRTLEFLGHNVIRANHVGDWGTQFGMLIAYLEKVQNENANELALSDLESFYRAAKKHYDEDEVFAEKARNYVVKLQGGDAYCLDMWRKLVDITMSQNVATYKRLNVTLSLEDTMGESLYNDMLAGVVKDLREKGLAVESDGATVVYLDEYKNKDGEPMGVIIQKRDGGYLYATTDIAAIIYRYTKLHCDRILYYTDSRQHQHLEQVWLIAHKAGYIPESLQLEHHMFGMMLGKDGKPFKTRSGETIKLNDLLDEALERALVLIRGKNPDLPETELHEIAEAVSIGAVKYADLSKNRTTDYVFDWDNMLAFEGNTAPYLQYAYTRVLSLFRKAELDIDKLSGEISLEHEKEYALAARLMQFEEAIQSVAKEGLPHILCAYLYDIATLFSSFYENCPVLAANTETQKLSRLRLSALTAKTLAVGFQMLGIKAVEKM
ncbi:arginine--tRNA ligase [Zophobihabitans entericus]|uniref:Arginine--tRNA ligase n=1 Tax=Zophobihabitans entericus TaxID=1635327 RepID=A0A6G9ICA7_9GAMM|nr:arginine--tRNA ligase [Zophobihabitans entericus]QIQ21868.1 arginine--tRNA ligase [Zophobihabitans entericus]